MAKKYETRSSEGIFKCLKKYGWFRNISDKVQVGIPDAVGGYKGLLFGFEIKAIKDVPVGGLAPKKSEHCFSPKQVQELKNINAEGGVGLGLIVCGRIAFFCTPEQIRPDGRVDCRALMNDKKFISKGEDGEWTLPGLLELCWINRMKQLWELRERSISSGIETPLESSKRS